MRFLPFEYWVGLRYAGLGRGRRKGKKDRFLSFVTFSTKAGIALSVCVLIIVLSVTNGFKVDIVQRMLSVLPDVQLYNPNMYATQTLQNWQTLAAEAKKNPEVVGASPLVQAVGVVSGPGAYVGGVQVSGIVPAYEGQVSELPEQIKQGSLDSLKPHSFNVIIGAVLARQMGVKVGDSIILLAPQLSASPAGFSPRLRGVKITGIYSTGYYPYDAGKIFMNAEDAAVLFRNRAVGGVRLKIKNAFDAPKVAQEVWASLPNASQIVARSWQDDNQNLFAALAVQKRVNFIVLFLMAAIAAFNLLSSLVMNVKDKQSEIAILRTIGVPPRGIGRIFLVQGTYIGFVGTLIGCFFGCLISYNIDVIVPFIEHLLGVQFLKPGAFFVSQVPSAPLISDILLVCATSMLLSFLSTVYPSWRAARTQPAEVLCHD